jgi:hypothetical protein
MSNKRKEQGLRYLDGNNRSSFEQRESFTIESQLMKILLSSSSYLAIAVYILAPQSTTNDFSSFGIMLDHSRNALFPLRFVTSDK